MEGARSEGGGRGCGQQALLWEQGLLSKQGLLALKRSNKPCRQPHFPTMVVIPAGIKGVSRQCP